MQVSAPGYETGIEPALDVAAGDALTRDIALYRTCTVLEDAVEPGPLLPFTPQPPWQKRAGAGQNGGMAWLQSASGNYANDLDVSLTSAILDLAGHSSVALRFDQRCNTEADWDYGIVEVSADGGDAWSEVFRCDGETQWRTVELPLPQLDEQATARVRFRFLSDPGVRAPGWAVDNIVLSAGGPACRASQLPQVQIDGFDATPGQVVAGSSATLAWTTQHATACEVGDSLGGAPVAIAPGALASGSLVVTPEADATYTLSCDGAGGPATAQATVEVLQPPVAIVAFDASPDAITLGDGSTLSWSTGHATACEIDSSLGGAPFAIAPNDLANGTFVVTPDADVTYTLQCEGAAGPVTAQATVEVSPPRPPQLFRDGFEAMPTR